MIACSQFFVGGSSKNMNFMQSFGSFPQAQRLISLTDASTHRQCISSKHCVVPPDISHAGITNNGLTYMQDLDIKRRIKQQQKKLHGSAPGTAEKEVCIPLGSCGKTLFMKFHYYY